MAWPGMPDFSDVVQNPSVCFEDNDLSRGQVAVNPRGLPLVYSGNFACVYKVSNGGREFAVRCFTREVRDQQQRYSQLDQYLSAARPDTFVRFQYLDRGIRVKGQWYPIVKMAWVEGERLDKFVERHLDAPDILRDMAARWRGANGSLRGLNIAHNDLQHGNVMVQRDEAIRLVDYDGIFLPRFHGEDSPELGHKNYQHPLRTIRDYDERIDNFPSLVLYLSLLAISSKPQLWSEFYNQENLILTKDDFAAPEDSRCFKELRNIRDGSVAELAAYLADLCSRPVDQVPDLESALSSFPSSPAPASTLAAAPQPVPGTSQPPTAGSDYRNLIQTGQISPTTPLQNLGLTCPKCHLVSSPELIYCAVESCATLLHPGSQTCKGCNSLVPMEAFFCTECGVNLNAPAKA